MGEIEVVNGIQVVAVDADGIHQVCRLCCLDSICDGDIKCGSMERDDNRDVYFTLPDAEYVNAISSLEQWVKSRRSAGCDTQTISIELNTSVQVIMEKLLRGEL